MDAYEQRMDKLAVQLTGLEPRIADIERKQGQVLETLNIISVDIKGLNEKFHWRINSLENQVEILLRGHLEWEGK
jgi:hypothetical protein